MPQRGPNHNNHPLLVTQHSSIYESSDIHEDHGKSIRVSQQGAKSHPHRRQCRHRKRSPLFYLYHELKTLLLVDIDPIETKRPKVCSFCGEHLHTRSVLRKHFKTYHPDKEIDATRGIIREGQNPVDLFFIDLPRSQPKPMESVYSLAMRGQHSMFFPKFLDSISMLENNQQMITTRARQDQRLYDDVTDLLLNLRSLQPGPQGISYGSVPLFETVHGAQVPYFVHHRINPRLAQF